MTGQLQLTIGQYTDKGRKEANQDFHGAYTPEEPQLSAKGIAIALADGISSSDVSHIAAETAVAGFLSDYFCTSDAWSVKKSAQCVISAINGWLHSQTRQSRYRYERDLGYVCAFSALVIKSRTAYLFHVGDARIYRLRGGAPELLTNDHRLWITKDQSCLSRALGVHPQVEIDYMALPLESGDVFLLATDGVYEFVDHAFVMDAISSCAHDLDMAAATIANEALNKGSVDNVTVQLVAVQGLPSQDPAGIQQAVGGLPLPPVLKPGRMFDGFKIARELYTSSHSHVHLAEDAESRSLVVIKTPSTELQDDPRYLERFMMEEWIARRLNDPHVVKPFLCKRARHCIYTVTEFIEGKTLSQWLVDNKAPDLETVRAIVEQIAKGLRALHRMEMVHQDLRPDNVMIDKNGTVKIIDFGSTTVAGIAETLPEQHGRRGTAQYTAPECFLGEAGSVKSDLFALGVIAYQMLTGRLPYGTDVAKCTTKAAQNRLVYRPAVQKDRAIPAWVDGALKKAVHPNPSKRYPELSEFLFDLRHPNQQHLSAARAPLLDRNPVLFWQVVSLFLALTVLALLMRQR